MKARRLAVGMRCIVESKLNRNRTAGVVAAARGRFSGGFGSSGSASGAGGGGG